MLDDSILDELDALLEAGSIFETDEYKLEETNSVVETNDFPHKLEEYIQLRKSIESFEIISEEPKCNDNVMPTVKEPTHAELLQHSSHEELKKKYSKTLQALEQLQNSFEKCIAHTTNEHNSMRLVYSL